MKYWFVNRHEPSDESHEEFNSEVLVSSGPVGAAQGATLWITQISVHIS